MNLALVIKEVSECSYNPNMRDYFVNIISELSNYLKTQQHKVFKVQVGMDVICQVKVILRQPFHNNVYDVPIAIQLTNNMPMEPPVFYIEPVPNTMINKLNRNINPINNRIETEGMKRWSRHSQIPSLIEEIKVSFTQNFPICKAQTNAQSSYIQQVSPNMYHQFQPQAYNDTSKSLNLNNSSYMANPNMAMGFGSNNPSYQVQMTPQKAQEECKMILMKEALTKVEPKYKEETNKIMQQNKKLQNYLKEFNMETDKLNQYLMNTDRITMASQDKLKEISEEISQTIEYINNSQNKQLTTLNCMDFISVGGERNNMILSLLAKEAMIEEILVITKKALEKQVIDCVEAIKFIRTYTRNLFAIRHQREKLIESNSSQY